MEKIYFSKNNYNILYNIIGEKIYKKYKTDLSKDSKFEEKLMKCLKTIYTDRRNFNIPDNLDSVKYSNELSKRVLDRMLNNFTKQYERSNNPHITKIDDINKSISQRTMSLNDSYSNKISNRPIPSVINNTQDMNHKYEELQTKRSVDNEQFQNVNLSYQDTNNMSQFQSIDNSQSNGNNYASYNGIASSNNKNMPNNLSTNPVQTLIRDPNDVNNRFEKIQSSRNSEIKSQPNNIDFRIKTDNNKKNINEIFEREQNKRINEVRDNPHNEPQNNTWNDQFSIQDQRQNQIKKEQELEMEKKNINGNSLDNQFKLPNQSNITSSQLSGQFNNIQNSQNTNQPPQLSGQFNNIQNSQNTNQPPQLSGQFNNIQNSQNTNQPPQLSGQFVEKFDSNETKQQDNILPGYGSNNKGDINSQFSSMFNSESEISKLSNSFENKSIQDRLAEFQRNRDSDLELSPNDISDTKKNDSFNNKYIGAPKLEYKESNKIENPKSLYSPLKINNDQTSLNASYVNNLSDVIPTPSPPQEVIKTYNLIVNSIDRKWEGVILEDNVNSYESTNTPRYDYVVNFNPTYDSYVEIPVYKNNEYIAFDFNKPDDKAKILRGMRVKNDSGFTYKNQQYQKYNPNEPNGDRMNTETKVFKGTHSGVNVDKSFKNIVSVKLKRLIIPSHDRYMNLNYSLGIDDDNKPINTKQYIPLGSKREPYLIIHIKELSSNIISTSTFNKPIFCKAHFDKEYCYSEKNQGINTYNSLVKGINNQYSLENYSKTNSDKIECIDTNGSRGWVYYKNDDGDISEYHTSPISELNKLSIQILKPNGELYSEEKDNLIVKEIICLKSNTTNNVGESCIILTLNKFVSSKYFRLGDKILIRGLVFEENESNKYLEPLTKYLEKGANIIGSRKKGSVFIGEYTEDLNINQIIIKYNITGIDDNGNNIYFGEGSDLEKIDKLADLITDDSKFSKCNGFLLNSNLQHSFVFEIKVREKDALTFNTPMMI